MYSLERLFLFLATNLYKPFFANDKSFNMNLFESRLFDWHSFLLMRDYGCPRCRHCGKVLPFYNMKFCAGDDAFCFLFDVLRENFDIMNQSIVTECNDIRETLREIQDHLRQTEWTIRELNNAFE